MNEDSNCPGSRGLRTARTHANSPIVDLSLPPYSCDPTGMRDCTAALCRALDDAMEADRLAQVDALRRMAEPGAVPEGPETRPGAVLFPRNAPSARILYLPAGTYRVSGTVGYSWTDHVTSRFADHLARGIHWLGDGPQRTILKLDDRCPGFEGHQPVPVLEILRGLKSAVCMQNTVEQLAIHTGTGNPAAVGLDFFSNNTGAVRDVEIRSGDGQGHCGLGILKWNSSCALIQRLKVHGFRFGVRISHHRLYSVLEDIHVEGQSDTGVWVESHNVSLHRLRSKNRGPALTISGGEAVVCAVDLIAEGTAPGIPAVDVREGHVFLRDLTAPGCHTAVRHAKGFDIRGDSVAEWTSHLPVRLFSNAPAASLRLPVEDPPPVPAPGAGWKCVSEFGAVGDGSTDDTAALRAAFASGASHLRFPAGRFFVNGPVPIPPSVRVVDFRFADLEAGPNLKAAAENAAFVIESGPEPLFLQRLFAMTGFHGPHRLICHEGVRDLVLRDMHTQFSPFYRNIAPGSRVFIENCACTCEGHEKESGFEFRGQRVWARQLNPERGHTQVLNEAGDLWVLGFKTENPSTAFATTGGGRTEILGGIFNTNRNYHPESPVLPTLVNEDSSVSCTASTTDWKIEQPYKASQHIVVRETRLGDSRHLYWEILPLRQPHLVALVLYSGKK